MSMATIVRATPTAYMVGRDTLSNEALTRAIAEGEAALSQFIADALTSVRQAEAVRSYAGAYVRAGYDALPEAVRKSVALKDLAAEHGVSGSTMSHWDKYAVLARDFGFRASDRDWSALCTGAKNHGTFWTYLKSRRDVIVGLEAEAREASLAAERDAAVAKLAEIVAAKAKADEAKAAKALPQAAPAAAPEVSGDAPDTRDSESTAGKSATTSADRTAPEWVGRSVAVGLDNLATLVGSIGDRVAQLTPADRDRLRKLASFLVEIADGKTVEA